MSEGKVSGFRCQDKKISNIVIWCSYFVISGLSGLGTKVKGFNWLHALTGSFILIFVSVKTLACPLELLAVTISIKGHPLAVELATTPKARVCGLSNRVKLSENHGMLFIYPTLGPRTFWMKDTQIPLSIAFLDDSGLILSIQPMTPMQTNERYRSLQPVRYALEVNQSWFAEHGIGVGDSVEMKLPVVIEIR